jgi:hypothetical protein
LRIGLRRVGVVIFRSDVAAQAVWHVYRFATAHRQASGGGFVCHVLSAPGAWQAAFRRVSGRLASRSYPSTAITMTTTPRPYFLVSTGLARAVSIIGRKALVAARTDMVFMVEFRGDQWVH